MTEISIKVEGLERLEKKLGKLVTAKRLLPSMKEAVKDVQRDMMEYPHAPSGSKYDRTNRLKNSWSSSATVASGETRGTVGTNVKYAPYVQSAKEQAKIHKKVWRKHTDKYVLAKRTRTIINNMQSDINRFWVK